MNLKVGDVVVVTGKSCSCDICQEHVGKIGVVREITSEGERWVAVIHSEKAREREYIASMRESGLGDKVRKLSEAEAALYRLRR